MLNKLVRVLLISSVIAVFTPAPQLRAAEQAGAPDSDQDQPSIVGSWIGTFENGERILVSFTSDGIVLSSVQTEVSATNPVLTPGHGVWARVSRRQFAFTDVVLLYDLQTGEYQGFGKLRGVLSLDKAGNLGGDNTVEIFDPNGVLMIALPHPFQLKRITVDRWN